MLIDWKDSYRTGIAEVDYEHRELVELINSLYAQLKADAPPATVAAFFGDLNQAITAHFALEERQMRERGYAALPEHKADHERLLDQLRQLMDGWQATRAEELGAALDDWFSRHFRTHDARLHSALGPHPH